MKRLLYSLRSRLVATVFVATLPALIVLYFTGAPWVGFAVGFLAMGAAWFGGELFVLHQVRQLLEATRRYRSGDLRSHTGLEGDASEFGQLARSFTDVVASLRQEIEQRDQVEKNLARRAQQQTAVAALGQLALVTSRFQELLDHAAQFVAQTLEVEFSSVLELTPDGKELLLRAGQGWQDGQVGQDRQPTTSDSQAGYTLNKGEPVVVPDLQSEHRFQTPALLVQHGVVSSMSVAIVLQSGRYGVLGAHTAKNRAFTEDEVHFLLSIATLLTVAIERKRAEAELHKLADFAQLNPNPAFELDGDGAITYSNDAAVRLALSINSRKPADLLPPNVSEIARSCLDLRQSCLHHQTQIEGRTLSWSFHPVSQMAVVHCYVEDITDRLSLEAQLRQAQKMESIGQLAAGVAHDFNNLLTIIQGHAGLLMARPELPPKLVESSQTVYAAAERAAGLTRQLLMFSRKNLMQLKPLDLRDVVGNLSKMLQRLLGEPVALQFQSPKDLPLVQADAGMVEQVLLNLAVNARDAMPKGGRLSIALAAVEVDAAHVAAHPQARTGRFVCLRAADTGCGMDAATLGRIFEPFFTTKEPGKGTGLGLATVYGIVQQHEGWIEVASQVDAGTTFSVFLPAAAHAPAPANPKPAAPATVTETLGGNERILLVEDEPVLLEMAVVLLEDCGYDVVAASTAVQALDLWHKQGGAFDLLLSDLVLPEGMSGLDLAERLQAEKAGLKVIFTSGYGIDDLGHEAVRRLNARFVQKPYSRPVLVHAVRKCLDGG